VKLTNCKTSSIIQIYSGNWWLTVRADV